MSCSTTAESTSTIVEPRRPPPLQPCLICPCGAVARWVAAVSRSSRPQRCRLGGVGQTHWAGAARGRVRARQQGNRDDGYRGVLRRGVTADDGDGGVLPTKRGKAGP